ncbi:Asp-tRNA(Asn)/Glu-tRNA(Gln) amidotransferase subunit GatC [Aerococcus sanguinicola]|uniref:Asp-tRNA(Asn)/Glu-tRNA(Gln) amidotransferase subunit GatC n=1 Tax=Aerococcus sanguinicola TaxID=119206 RepID=UPI0018A7C41A|nr:Asp-tRNA(Asn)/Glu-tRNA(Gln) amidotransferase subunit GatC [Aerococcus sanguinicola]
MEVNKDLIQHVAKLAKLSFTDEEIDKITDKFENIIHMVDQLEEVDTTDTPIMTWGIDLENVLREDEPVPGPGADVLLKNAQTSRDGFIGVPTVIDESEDNA